MCLYVFKMIISKLVLDWRSSETEGGLLRFDTLTSWLRFWVITVCMLMWTVPLLTTPGNPLWTRILTCVG